ncbi:MAG: hypothetical protein MI862_22680 [Desulfobacterales bacterium]|nr:hypothetical protein [Desulfobacterales bacterium]
MAAAGKIESCGISGRRNRIQKNRRQRSVYKELKPVEINGSDERNQGSTVDEDTFIRGYLIKKPARINEIAGKVEGPLNRLPKKIQTQI